MGNEQLRQITKEELDNILEQHNLWLETRFSDEVKGERADLRYVNLSSANLIGADLSNANLSCANLSRANFSRGNFIGAELDFSCFPLWCGGLNIHIDDKQAIQLLYHLVRNVQFSKNTSDELKALLLQPQIIEKSNEFHRVSECGKIEFKEEVEQ